MTKNLFYTVGQFISSIIMLMDSFHFGKTHKQTYIQYLIANTFGQNKNYA